MGMFATFTYAEQRWVVDEEEEAIDGSTQPEPFLSATVHDSDVCTVVYGPGPATGGLVYLGFQPRDYFDDPDASDGRRPGRPSRRTGEVGRSSDW